MDNLPSVKPELLAMTIGWREYIGLSELGLTGIKAKIDTGARTSALHAFRLEEFERQGAIWVRFWIRPLRKLRSVEVVCESEIVDRRIVSDSGGHRESRVVIRTPATLGAVTWPIEITLTDRDSMIFPMLLGRTAMEGRIIVDPSRSYSFGHEAGKQFKSALLARRTP